MSGWVWRGIGLVILVAGAFAWSLGGSGNDEAVYEPTSITDYVAEFEVTPEGDVEVVEQITVLFPPGRRGIFRFWDTRDDNDPEARRTPRDIRITRDGQSDPVEISHQERGRYVVARVGDPNRTLPAGEHIYEIRYGIDGVLLEDEAGGSRFYWDLVPGGWQQEIRQARLIVNLPAPPDRVRCAVGTGSEGGCDVSGLETSQLVISADELPPLTPVTLEAAMAIPVPPGGDRLPWPQRFDAVLGTSVAVLGLVGALIAIAAALGLHIRRSVQEEEPGFPLVYAPPAGIGPAQGAYVLNEGMERDYYVASILQAAEHGAVDVELDEASWTVTDSGRAETWDGVDPATRQVARLFGGPGQSLTVRTDDKNAGKYLKARLDEFDAATRLWARDAGVLRDGSVSGLGRLGIGLTGLAAVALLIFNPLSMSVTALVPGVFFLGALDALFERSKTVRTRSGRRLWSEVGGFERVLSTPSSIDRFDFAARGERYIQYLPWAVAFGCADEWAEKYRFETGSEPPVPPYLHAHYGLAVLSTRRPLVATMTANFTSTLDSAISSYEASQRSSSGGGGGFSGGGGGGGGGGGSW